MDCSDDEDFVRTSRGTGAEESQHDAELCGVPLVHTETDQTPDWPILGSTTL